MVDDANFVIPQASGVARLTLDSATCIGQSTVSANSIGVNQGQNSRTGDREVVAQDEVGKAAGRIDQDIAIVRDRAGKGRGCGIVKLHQACTGEFSPVSKSIAASELEDGPGRGRRGPRDRSAADEIGDAGFRGDSTGVIESDVKAQRAVGALQDECAGVIKGGAAAAEGIAVDQGDVVAAEVVNRGVAHGHESGLAAVSKDIENTGGNSATAEMQTEIKGERIDQD